jgi:hypothetical protein
MEEIPFGDGVSIALDALLNDRLALLCGAGLSMAPPSLLPAAATLAAAAKEKYDGIYGTTRNPLATNIDDQAEYFFRRHELATVYFRTLIDLNAFAGPPNPGHYAIADLLLIGGIQTAVTTNVDFLIETAGQQLFGQVCAGIDGASVAMFPPDCAPLLKVHGCRVRDPDNMVWAPGQLAAPPVDARIASSDQWLRVRLLDRDLIIVGYWTDWDYLNEVLATTLGEVRPSRVIVVNPADRGTFPDKAPALYALGQRAAGSFQHVSASGAEFLEALRKAFSKSFVRRVLHAGREEHRGCIGCDVPVAWTEPPSLDNDTLWRVRRDLEGCLPSQPARSRSPPEEPLLGLTILQLRAAGAVADGPYWRLGTRRIRVLRAVNQPLHRVQAAFDRELAPTVAPDIIVAIGAESLSLPNNIARVGTEPTIARGSVGRWFTRTEAIEELGI